MANHSLLRRALLLSGLCLSVSNPVFSQTTLPGSMSLMDDLKKALAKRSPLLVMVSLDGCPYCQTVRESHLAPLVRREGLPVVQVDMRSKSPIKDFKGSVVTHDSLIRSWGVRVAPTVLFFGPGGEEISERLVGGYIPDFYGSYLDERLRLARMSLKG
jgi:thioredoxin-related protein